MPMRVRPGHCHRRGRWGRSDLLVQPDRCHRRMGALRSAGVHATQRCPTVAIDGWARSPTQVLSDCCHRRMGAFHSAGKYAATAARPLPSADGLATACTVRHQRQEHKLSLCTTTTAITYCVLWPAASVDRQDCWPTCASARMAQSRPSAPRGVPPPGPTMIGPRTHESHNIHADTTRPRSHTHLHILDVCAYALFSTRPRAQPTARAMADMVKFCAMGSTDAASAAPPDEGSVADIADLATRQCKWCTRLSLRTVGCVWGLFEGRTVFQLRVGRALICLGCVFWRAFRSDQTKACAARTLPTR